MEHRKKYDMVKKSIEQAFANYLLPSDYYLRQTVLKAVPRAYFFYLLNEAA